MKKIILLVIPLVMGLISCDKSSKIPNQEEVNKVKEILSKQDLSDFNTKYLKATYSQQYDVLDICNEEDEINTSYFNYIAPGFFGEYYDLTAEEYNSVVDDNGNVDIFDAIAQGKGYYGYVQLVRTMSFDRENSAESEINNLDILQSVYLKSTDQDVWVDNTLYVTNEGIFDYSEQQRLVASINKELLFSSVSARTFHDIFSKVVLTDAQGNVEHLDKQYYSICRDLVSKNDKEISDFIIENQISIETDEEENNIKVNFVYANEDVEEEELDYIFPGEIQGTLFFNKDTYEFLNFSYDIAYKAETYDEKTGSIRLINTSFHCEGETARELPHDTWEPTNPTVYDDVAEFLKDVGEQVVPPEICL